MFNSFILNIQNVDIPLFQMITAIPNSSILSTYMVLVLTTITHGLLEHGVSVTLDIRRKYLQYLL